MVALNAVAPFMILLGIGFLAVRTGLTDRAFMNRLNALTSPWQARRISAGHGAASPDRLLRGICGCSFQGAGPGTTKEPML